MVGWPHRGCSPIRRTVLYSLYQSKGKVIGQMLYDHRVDPEEDHNLAEEPEFASVVDRLRKKLIANLE